jgi:diguanylate cyclase (GGDEF)-like protein/PAS domain S-box-containing protein
MFKNIVEKALDSICLLNDKNEIEYANAAFLSLSGFTQEELLGKDFGIVLPPEIAEIHAELIQKFINRKDSSSTVLGKIRKLEILHKQGELIPVELLAFEVTNSASEGRKFAGILRDLREREYMTMEYNRLLYDMEKMGYMDPLTQLPNEKYILSRFNSILNHHQGIKESIYGIIDVDGLSGINKKNGREAGNQILKKIGSDLRNSIRMKDIIARTNADDFSCIFPDSSLSEIINLIDNFRAKLSRKVGLINDDPLLQITVSIGLTRILNPVKSPEEYQSEAQSALKKAKSEGKNKLFIFGFY